MKISEKDIPLSIARVAIPKKTPTIGKLWRISKEYIVIFEGEDTIYEFNTFQEAQKFLLTTVLEKEKIEIEYGDEK